MSFPYLVAFAASATAGPDVHGSDVVTTAEPVTRPEHVDHVAAMLAAERGTGDVTVLALTPLRHDSADQTVH